MTTLGEPRGLSQLNFRSAFLGLIEAARLRASRLEEEAKTKIERINQRLSKLQDSTESLDYLTNALRALRGASIKDAKKIYGELIRKYEDLCPPRYVNID
jgi:hypothetical protein